MSLAFGGRGYIVRSRDTDAGIGIEFDSTLGFPGEGPMKKRDRKRKLVFKRINLEATAAAVMQQVQIQADLIKFINRDDVTDSFTVRISYKETYDDFGQMLQNEAQDIRLTIASFLHGLS